MRIAAVQMDIAWEDRKSNFEKVSRFAEQAADRGADFLVLPEMFATGFSMSTALTEEPLDGITPSFIRDLANRFHMGVAGGFVLKQPNGKARNCALIVDRQGADLALYTKTYLFSFMGEDKHHQAGTGPVLFDFEGFRSACFICYDLRFPELFRKVCQSVHAAFVIASWPASRAHHWDVLLSARAIENQFYMIGVNRTGKGDGLLFDGRSTVIDPAGAVEARLGDQEGLLIGEITLDRVQMIRNTMPFLKDCRKLSDG